MAVTAGAGAGRRLLRPASQAAGATGVPTRPASGGGEERVAPGGAQPKLRNDAAPGPFAGGPPLAGNVAPASAPEAPGRLGRRMLKIRSVRSTRSIPPQDPSGRFRRVR